jgi:hypothetical protein
MSSKGYNYTDQRAIPVSTGEFKTGGRYGVEIPVINTPKVVENTIKAIHAHDVQISRFNETHGSFMLTDRELEEMLTMCRESGYGMVIGLGPRPEYDIKGSFYRSEFGLEMGRRNNNLDAVRVCVEEAISEARRVAPDLCLDVPTDVYKTKGGFIRFYELAELIQAASPVMLKMGASAQGHPYDNVGDSKAFERVKRVALGLDILRRQDHDFSMITAEDHCFCLPKEAHAFSYKGANNR